MEDPLQAAAFSSHRLAMNEEEVIGRPFYRLVHFRGEGTSSTAPVLVVAPLSGHTSLLLYDFLGALAPDHDLYLLEWMDAREVALAAGDFGMDDNIAAILDCIERLQGQIHLIGLCQSAMPSLSAAALRASLALPGPLSVTLFGGMIDPRINPTRIGRFAAEHALSWFEDCSVDTVPPFFKGHDRRVHPAYLQRVGLQAYLARHFATGGELLFKVMGDDGADRLHHPFLTLFLTLMDLPATLYLDEIRQVFQEFAMPSGRLKWRGILVEPKALTRCALLTIEGGRDDISGLGQTSVAHDLCANIPASRRRHYLQPDMGHFGLFHGAVWRQEILPQVSSFIRGVE